VTSGRNYVVQADNPREREDWIDTIRAALGRFSTYVNARRPIGKLHVRVSQAREVNAQSQLIYCVLQYAKQRHRTGMANAVLAGSMRQSDLDRIVARGLLRCHRAGRR
jgi:hypothetical protein